MVTEKFSWAAETEHINLRQNLIQRSTYYMFCKLSTDLQAMFIDT